MRLKNLCKVLLLAVLCGCAYAPAGIAPSSSPVDPNNYTVLGQASGEHSYFSLFGWIPLGELDYNAAIEDAISKYDGGKALIDVRSTMKITWAVVGFIYKIEVEGKVVK